MPWKEKNIMMSLLFTTHRLLPSLLPNSSEAKDGEYFEGNSRYEGYSFDLIEGISKILNFKYRIEIVPDGKYGSLNKETKKWDGLVKHLLDRVSGI